MVINKEDYIKHGYSQNHNRIHKIRKRKKIELTYILLFLHDKSKIINIYYKKTNNELLIFAEIS